MQQERNIKKFVKEAEKTFEEFGMSERIANFLASERVNNRLNENFDSVKALLAPCVEKAPESLKEKAASVFEKLFSAEGKELYLSETQSYFKLYLVDDFSKITKITAAALKESNFLEKIFEDEKASDEDFNLIFDLMKEMLVTTYITAVYGDYKPEKLSEESKKLVDFLAPAGGGIFIPMESITSEVLKIFSERAENGATVKMICAFLSGNPNSFFCDKQSETEVNESSGDESEAEEDGTFTEECENEGEESSGNEEHKCCCGGEHPCENCSCASEATD